MCVLSVNIGFAQNCHQNESMMKPHFQFPDSAFKGEWMNMDHKAFWEKRMKENEKRWKGHMPWGGPRFMGHWPNRHGFAIQPQEETAQFIGGTDALSEWITDNITYPIMADANAIEGKVVVTFDVNVDGSIGNIKVKESANPILDSEVVEKVKEMPRWIPARQNGRIVKMKYTLPIKFTALS